MFSKCLLKYICSNSHSQSIWVAFTKWQINFHQNTLKSDWKHHILIDDILQ